MVIEILALAGSYSLLMLAAVVGAVSRAITLPLSYAVAGSRLRGEAARRRSTLPGRALDDVDDLCVQAASDALMAILDKLNTYKTC